MVPLLPLLAMNLLGAASPLEEARASASTERPQISYEVRVLTAPAAGWRAGFYKHCKRVGRDGLSTVWTLDEAKAAELVVSQLTDPSASICEAPKVTAFAKAPAQISNRTPTNYIADLDIVRQDGPGKTSSVAFKPIVGTLQAGWSVRIDGETVGSVVNANVAIESLIVTGLSNVPIPESADGPSGKTYITGQIQVPEVVESKFSGSYEIPKGQVLMVSLGTDRISKGGMFGKEVIRDRLALISARPILTEAEEVRIGRTEAETSLIRTAIHSRLQAKRPPLPSRSPLPAVGPDGRTVVVPAPVDESVVTARHVGPPSPLPSPQMAVAKPSRPTDPSVSRTGHEEAQASQLTRAVEAGCCDAGKDLNSPKRGKFSIEIKATFTPGTPVD